MSNNERNLGTVGHYTVERPFAGKLNGETVYTTIEVLVDIEGILHTDEDGFRIELRPEAPWDKYWEPEDNSFNVARSEAKVARSGLLNDASRWFNEDLNIYNRDSLVGSDRPSNDALIEAYLKYGNR